MYERFLDDARGAMASANLLARQLRHPQLRTEHILSGLIDATPNAAATILAGLVRSLRKVDEDNAAALRSLSLPALEGPVPDELPHAPEVEAVLRHAFEEMRRMNGKYAGTVHLLAGLLLAEGGTSEILDLHNVTIGDVRSKIEAATTHPVL